MALTWRDVFFASAPPDVWYSGTYVFNRSDIINHRLNYIDWSYNMARGYFSHPYARFPSAPAPVQTISNIQAGKCSNSSCYQRDICDRFHVDGGHHFEPHFVPPDNHACSMLIYSGFHPDVKDKTNGENLGLFGIYSGSKSIGRWVGAYQSKEEAASIVGLALDYTIDGYSNLSLHTFDKLPDGCKLFADPIDSVF